MENRIAERLAEAQVPPVPEDLADEFHLRLNKHLLLVHLIDFSLRAMGYACLQFVEPWLDLLWTTLAGPRGAASSSDKTEE